MRKLFREALAPLEIASFWLQLAQIDKLPRGDGHPVMFLPGFTMGDEALRPMARAFEKLGYAVYGWGQGRNIGLSLRTAERLQLRLQEIHYRHQAKVSLVGWSAGGLYARELAHARPEWVRRIIIFGSPIRPNSGNEMVDLARSVFDAVLEQRGSPRLVPADHAPPVLCTAIHSKNDGVVSWRAALEASGPNVENLEVEGAHLALGYNLDVLRIIAERLPIDPQAATSKKPSSRRRSSGRS